MNSNKTFLQRVIVITSLAYLLIPNILFLLGWVQWWYSIPVALLLTGACIYVCTRLPRARVKVGSYPLLGILFALLICFFTVESLGYSGRVPQSGDFIARNAIYDTIVRCDWPLKSNTGDYFVYYHVFYLPAAIISRMLEGILSSVSVVYIWTLLGLVLIAGLYAMRFGPLKGSFGFLITLLLGYLPEWLRITYTALNQLHLFGEKEFLNLISFLPYGFAESLASNWRAVGIDSPHHGIPVLLFLSLVATNCISPLHVFLCAALIVPASPYASIAVLLYLFIRYHQYLRKHILSYIRGVSWVGVLLLIPVAAFFLTTDGNIAIRPVFAHGVWQGLCALLFFALCVLLVIGPAFYFVDKRYRRTAAFIFLVATTPLIPFIYNSDDLNAYNIVLKFSVVTSFCQAWVYFPAFFRFSRQKKVLFIFFFTAASAYAVLHSVKQLYFFATDPLEQRKNCQLAWDGHLNHQYHKYYKNFFTGNPIPFILYQNEGESSRHVLAPFATGKSASEIPDAPGFTP